MRILRLRIAMGLLPLAPAALLALMDLAAPLGLLQREPAWLTGGFAAWCLVWLVLPRPVMIYVLGHELTHALWARAMGAKVSNMSVGRAGGSVTVSKSNLWIALAPYFFPLYTVLLIFGAAVAGLFVDLSPWAHWLLAAVGATWGFHFTFTIQMLAVGQSDLRPYGTFLSLVVIVVMNAAGLMLGVVAAGPATLEQAVETCSSRTRQAYVRAAGLAETAWHRTTGTEAWRAGPRGDD